MQSEVLHNRKSREQLQAQLALEQAPRQVASFYRYTDIANPYTWRDELYRAWQPLGVLGRIYVAHEGINAQFSVPQPQWQAFVASLEQWPATAGVFINKSAHGKTDTFLKLKIKARRQIVADGLPQDLLCTHQPAPHLPPMEFNQKMTDPMVQVIDVRNHYECETGYFAGAYLPKSERFADVLPEIKQQFATNKSQPLLLYCTGGIRCEKASAYLKSAGFENVYQLQGGIVNYLNTMQASALPAKFIGSLFVFDGRMAEPSVNQVISRCYQCQTPHDVHSDCAYPQCHELILQCPQCHQQFDGCCSLECQQNLLNQG